MNVIAEEFLNVTNAYRKNMGLDPLGFGDAVEIPDTSAENLAYDWMERCKESVASAQDVLKEIEITEHGDFVAKAMWMLANVGIYTNRDKIVRELIDALEATLLECAGQ